MINERFRELVNLYLDKEIDSLEMELLQAEISKHESRRKEFDTACRLHHAMSRALSAEVAENEARSGMPFARWMVGIGMAASFVLGGILLAPSLSDELIPGKDRREAQAAAEALVAEAKEQRLKRFLAVQNAALKVNEPCRSLAAQFRLLGLQPALIPAEDTLEAVEVQVRRVHVEWNDREQRWQYVTVSERLSSDLMRDFNRLFADNPFDTELAGPNFILNGAEVVSYSER